MGLGRQEPAGSGGPTPEWHVEYPMRHEILRRPQLGDIAAGCWPASAPEPARLTEDNGLPPAGCFAFIPDVPGCSIGTSHRPPPSTPDPRVHLDGITALHSRKAAGHLAGAPLSAIITYFRAAPGVSCRGLLAAVGDHIEFVTRLYDFRQYWGRLKLLELDLHC